MESDLFETRSKKQWNKIYREEKTLGAIQKEMSRIINVFRKYNIQRVLDLACGSGRYTAYLAEKGFELYGIDISEEGIKKAESLLQDRSLHANFTVGSMYKKLPYEDGFFDAVVCIRALHHGRIENIQKAISEIERVLKPNGLVYATVRKRIPKNRILPHRYIAPRTYVPLEGKEKGLVHYLFNKNLLKKEFRNFEILDLWIDYGPKYWESYYCLLGKLKD